MAVTRGGSVIVVTGTETLAGPIDIQSVQNNATTSFTITRGSVTMLSGGAGGGAILNAHIRSAGPIVVTVTGGGSVTLHLRVEAER